MTIRAEDQMGFEWRPTAEQERKFAEHHAANPTMWLHFERFTLEAIRAGLDHYSADAVLHRVRWFTTVDEGGTFKCNNIWTPFYSRLWAQTHPEHAAFFRRRKSRADKEMKVRQEKEAA